MKNYRARAPKFPNIVVEPPGPIAQKLIKRITEIVGYIPGFPGLAVADARGAVVTDVDGNSFIDLAQSVSVSGHCHPKVITATKSQLKRLMIGGIIAKRVLNQRIKLAEQLLNLMSGSLKDYGMVNYCTTGSEACDFAVRLARKHTQKPIIICYQGAYHGSTGLTLSLTTSSINLRRHSRPLISEIVYVPYPNCYRCIFGREYSTCNLDCLRYIGGILRTVAHPEDVAAVIIEPIQVHNGVIVPPGRYMSALRRLCRQNNIMFLDDEVFTGFGKTGKMFAIEYFGVEPNIICLGKAMGGGLPIAAFVSRREIMMDFSAGGTMHGNLIACTAALANLEVIREEKLINNAEKIGHFLLRGLEEFAEKCDMIGDVRGKGLLIGVELVKDKSTKEPATKETQEIVRRAFKRGILITSSGVYHNVINIAPPLIITEEQAETALEVLGNAFKDVQGTK